MPILVVVFFFLKSNLTEVEDLLSGKSSLFWLRW